MVDRQDIDALLVGALYGELTPAEEARLHTHLESHPADRGALDDLKSARAAVRESRVFDLQAEPPQAVSALLLQEAHRRAPRRAPEERAKDGWLARLARSFVMHPAMAAAATLVLVIGVAGGLYLHNGGDQLDRRVASAGKNDETMAAGAPREIDQRGRDGDGVALETASAAGSAAAPAPSANGDETYDVSLADKKLGKAEAQKVAPAPALAAAPTPKPVAHASRSEGIVVSRPDTQPKDLDRAKGYGYKVDNEVTRDVGGVAGGGHASSGLGYGPSSNASPAPAAGAAAPPPPSAEQAPAATPTTPKSRKTMADDEDAPMTKEAPKASEDAQWAAGRYAAALGFARQSDCKTAARIANDIQSKAPSYYAEKVADDRELKGCMSYVNSVSEKSAVRAKKSAPAKAKAAAAPAAADEKPATATTK
jgi:hypothetical protein